jgi:peroxiredoxin
VTTYVHGGGASKRRALLWAALLVLALPLPLPLAACATAPPARAVVVGRQAPSATFTLPDGRKAGIETARGRVLVLAFFTTYCPTSPALLRAMNVIRASRDHSVLEVVAVHEGEDAAQVEAQLAKLDVKVHFVSDRDGAAAARMGLETIPSVVIVDHEGIVRHVHAGFHGAADRAAIDREVSVLLASTPPRAATPDAPADVEAPDVDPPAGADTAAQ